MYVQFTPCVYGVLISCFSKVSKLCESEILFHCTKKFSIKDFFSKMWPNPEETVVLVTFTEEILNEKKLFFCAEFDFVLFDFILERYIIPW